MAGLGKIMKQAQQMQKQMQSVQEKLAEQIIDVSFGGDAVNIKINGQGEFQSIKISPELLQESPEFIEETLLSAVQEAAQTAKKTSEEAMLDVTNGLGGFPGV